MKIVIIGNSGAGKSYLAKRQADTLSHPVISLDDLFWEPSGDNKKRSKEDSITDAQSLSEESHWIAEGVFGHLASIFTPHADLLIWLDLDWKTCKQQLLARGPLKSEDVDPASSNRNFDLLVEWASQYWTRETTSSHKGHAEIFEQFAKRKIICSTKDEANQIAFNI